MRRRRRRLFDPTLTRFRNFCRVAGAVLLLLGVFLFIWGIYSFDRSLQ